MGRKTAAPRLLTDEGKTVRLATDRRGLPLLEQFSEEGFVDCVFRIDELVRRRGHYLFRLRASSAGAEVGFACRVVRGIQSGFDTKLNINPSRVYREGVEFIRSGPESDRLVRVLLKRYGVRKPAQKMVRVVSFTAIALHRGPLDVEHEPVKLKLFGADRPDDPRASYNESFFNLDLAGGLVFWNEKDADYRQALIRALTVPA